MHVNLAGLGIKLLDVHVGFHDFAEDDHPVAKLDVSQNLALQIERALLNERHLDDARRSGCEPTVLELLPLSAGHEAAIIGFAKVLCRGDVDGELLLFPDDAQAVPALLDCTLGEVRL